MWLSFTRGADGLCPEASAVYDPGDAEAALGFRCRTDFAAVLDAIRQGRPLPFEHDPAYVSPALSSARTGA